MTAESATLERPRQDADVLLSVENLSMHFPVYKGIIRRQVGVIIDTARALDRIGVAVLGIDVGVAAHGLAALAAQKVVDRLPRRLADDIPAGDLQPRQHRHQRGVGPKRVARAIGHPPQMLDAVRIDPLEMPPEHIAHHIRHHMGPERRRIDLADPGDAVIGGEFHEDEIPPAPARRRVADDEDLAIAQLHGPAPNTITLRRPIPARTLSIAVLISSNG